MATHQRQKPEPVDPVWAYAQAITADQIIAGPHVRAACKRHLLDLDQGPARGLRWDLKKALHCIQFVETFLRLNGGEFEGRPFLLEPWQKFIIGSLFGWLRDSTGARRFTTAYMEIGKGNGKSPLAAAVGFIGLIVDDEPRAEIYAAATKKDQAMILFRDAVAMLDQSPDLVRRLYKSGIGERCWNMAYPATHSFFRPISSDDGQSGPRPHIGLIDEVHEHKTGDVIDMMRRGVKGRRQPIMFEITNSGVDRNSICWAHHEASIKAANALPGEQGFDDNWFSYVSALDDGDDWLNDPACWEKANPNLGVSIQRKYLEDAVREARNIPSRQNMIARLNFCIWTESVSAWMGRDAWMACERELRIEDFAGRTCYVGIDLSSHRDLTAGALFFPDGKGGGDLFVEFWTPSEGLREREDHDQAPYLQWVRDGWLRTTPGGTVDYRYVVQWLGAIAAQYQVAVVAYDRWRIDLLKREMSEAGLVLEMKEFGQGYKDMTPAITTVESLILDQRMRVAANPLLRWNAACAVVDSPTQTEKKFAKAKTNGRIDGLVAGTMAIGCAIGDNPASRRSVYEDRGVVEFEV